MGNFNPVADKIGLFNFSILFALLTATEGSASANGNRPLPGCPQERIYEVRKYWRRTNCAILWSNYGM